VTERAVIDCLEIMHHVRVGTAAAPIPTCGRLVHTHQGGGLFDFFSINCATHGYERLRRFRIAGVMCEVPGMMWG
jgi:hypothetical protein